MKVLIFHPVHLPPKDYGGVERVVLWLAKGLRELGHDVTVAALEGSGLPAGVELLAMAPGRRGLVDLLRSPLLGKFDVIHFMAPPEAEWRERIPCPWLLTVHGNGRPGEIYPLNAVFLSRDHATRHGADAFVYNGLDPAEFAFDPRSKEDRFLFLSKTSWSVKNLAGAVNVCGKAGVELRIAGGNRPIGLRLRAALSPRLSWEGPVAGARKARLLAQAKGLVFPVVWPEPFGLVVAEALLSGTPVIASKTGSLPELLPARAGAVLEWGLDPSRLSAWVETLRNGRWEPEACRSWALERFHYMKMAEGYLAAYRKVVSGEVLNASEPRGTDWREQLRRARLDP